MSTKDDKLRHFSGENEPKTAVPESSETPDGQENAGTPKRDKKGRFPKGVSGNPKGGCKGPRTLTSTLKALLREPDDKRPHLTKGDRLMQLCYLHAAKGNFQFFKEILERIEGKVPDRVEAVLSDGWEMEYGDAENEEEQEPGDA